MPKKEESRWLAAYLYYNEPWEKFLVQAVLPYVRTALKTGIAKEYFFIRYWERGPHIRLRFSGDPELLKNVLQPNLTEHFQSYFDSRPSTRVEPEYPKNLPNDYHWQSNNSIEYQQYHPEIERYGGGAAVKVAEKQFYYSSQTVLQNLESKKGKWSYDDTLGTAIKLHLSFAYAVGMTLDQVKAFFHFYFYNWLPRSLHHQSSQSSFEEVQQQTQETLTAFEASFIQQKESLVSFHKTMWQALEEQEVFEEEGLNQWMVNNGEIARQLEELLQTKQLKWRSLRYQYNTKDLDLDEGQKQLWMQYADYLHMTNNRLGVLNQDEGYLAYLMMKSMET